MSSVSKLGVFECSSCGHLIGRGRLTCSHCGAAAPVKTVLTAGITFYKTINRDFENHHGALSQLLYLSTKINTIFPGNDVTIEIQFENFLDFWQEISARTYSHREVRHVRKSVRLFQSLIKIDKDVSFFRFIAVDGGILYLCEVNTKAESYLSEKKWEAQKARRLREIDRKIRETTSVLGKYRIDLEHKQAKKSELESVIMKWKSESWLERRKTKCVSTERISSEIADLENKMAILNGSLENWEGQKQ